LATIGNGTPEVATNDYKAFLAAAVHLVPSMGCRVGFACVEALLVNLFNVAVEAPPKPAFFHQLCNIGILIRNACD
jgi:hypothetical protein